MCMIIYRPAAAKGQVSKETLHYCASNNPHGLGLMWADKGKLLTARYEHKDRKVCFARLLSLQAQNIPFCAHFRFMTHGAETKGNTHPFWIHKGHSALMHNGIFNIKTETGWSDTRTFVARVLRPMALNWLDVPHLRYLVSEATHGNRVAVMERSGKVTILHENSGQWDDGIWYANSGYKKPSYLGDLFGKGKSYSSGATWRYDGEKKDWYNDKGDRSPSYPGSSYHNGAANGYGYTRHYGGVEGYGKQSDPIGYHAPYRPKNGHSKVKDIPRLLRAGDPAPTAALFAWSDHGQTMTLCGTCLRMETRAEQEAKLIMDPSELTCDLCEIPGHKRPVIVPDPADAAGNIL